MTIIIIDHDFKRSDSGSDSGLSGNGARARPVPVAFDNQETNNIATLTVTYEIEDEFCVMTINSKCKVHCIIIV